MGRGDQAWPREPRSIRYIINWAKDLTEYRCGRRFSEMYSWYLAATCASSDTDRYKSSDAGSGSPYRLHTDRLDVLDTGHAGSTHTCPPHSRQDQLQSENSSVCSSMAAGG